MAPCTTLQLTLQLTMKESKPSVQPQLKALCHFLGLIQEPDGLTAASHKADLLLEVHPHLMKNSV